VSSVLNMDEMFAGASSFTYKLCSWKNKLPDNRVWVQLHDSKPEIC